MESIGKLLEKVIILYEKKEYDGAQKAVDELLASHPDFHRAQFLKAVILEETGRSDEAEKHYAKAGNKFTLWIRLALQLHDVDPERAITYYERVSKMDPQNNLVWFNLGNLYEKMHRIEEARLCFRNLSPVKEIASRIFIPLGFMIFLVGGAILMIQHGEKVLSSLVIASAVFCLVWLKRDSGKAMQMLGKKIKYK
ncbi:MAG TPA: tetratricopeptide repeat protein [Nitrospirota bacterium]|nr:tetratricopeptide repeat protein [Nitrospirota bacterium]